MRIVHVCLTAPFRYGWGYQENILVKKHIQMGHDVTVLSYKDVKKFDSRVTEQQCQKDVPVKLLILERSKGYLGKHLKIYKGIYHTLEEEMPDVVFVHGGQFFSFRDVIKFCRLHPEVRLYVDQHGDYYNTPIVNFKKRVLHKIIFGHWLRKAIPFTRVYWGVTPWRCQYLHEVYGIPQNKIDLLVMGGDDDYIDLENRDKIKDSVRATLSLSSDDFVIITGGKIDKSKNIHLLMKSVSMIDEERIKLVVFGQPTRDIENEIRDLSADNHIRNVGWLESTAVYDYFMAADLAFFPGTHSVLWEQAAACGIPLVVKDWEGMHHLDVGGNCIFLKDDSEETYARTITRIFDDSELFSGMKNVAENVGTKIFSYNAIAKKSIEATIDD